MCQRSRVLQRIASKALVLADARQALVWIIALGLILRIALMLLMPQQPFSDGQWYVDRAREILSGAGYSELGVPTAYWPPGQPFLIAATQFMFGPSLLGPLLANLIAVAAIIWLVHWFGLRIANNKRAGVIAALIYAVYPAHIAYAGQPLSESTSTAIGMAAMALLLAARGRLRWMFAAGLLFGLVSLFRAQMLYFPLGMLIAMAVLIKTFSWKRAVVGGVLLYIGAFAIILPWTVRNEQVLGAPVLVSTNGGVALYNGASPYATGDHVEWTPEIWEQSGVPFAQRTPRQLEVDRGLKRAAFAWIKAHPAQYLMLMPKKAIVLWVKDSDGFWGLGLTYPAQEGRIRIVQWANQAWYLLLLVLALPCLVAGLWGWFGRGNRKHQTLLLLFLMPAFVTLTAILFSGQVRYHFPAMPFMIVAVGWTLARWFERKSGQLATSSVI